MLAQFWSISFREAKIFTFSKSRVNTMMHYICFISDALTINEWWQSKEVKSSHILFI